MTSNEDKIEAVNGKIDLGVRKLKAAYIENATTIYAYIDIEFDKLKEYTDKINEAYSNADELQKGKFLKYIQQFTLFEIFIFCPKIQFWLPEKNCWFFGWKTRENVVVLGFLAVDDFDFTRNIVKKKKWGEKLVKMFGQKFDFSNSVSEERLTFGLGRKNSEHV